MRRLSQTIETIHVIYYMVNLVKGVHLFTFASYIISRLQIADDTSPQVKRPPLMELPSPTKPCFPVSDSLYPKKHPSYASNLNQSHHQLPYTRSWSQSMQRVSRESDIEVVIGIQHQWVTRDISDQDLISISQNFTINLFTLSLFVHLQAFLIMRDGDEKNTLLPS